MIKIVGMRNFILISRRKNDRLGEKEEKKSYFYHFLVIYLLKHSSNKKKIDRNIVSQ